MTAHFQKAVIDLDQSNKISFESLFDHLVAITLSSGEYRARLTA